MLIHGSHGLGKDIYQYIKYYTGHGFVVICPDTFFGISYQSVSNKSFYSPHDAKDVQIAFTLEQQVITCLSITKTMMTHPNVDRDRMAVMGFSRGGIIAHMLGCEDNLFRSCVSYYTMLPLMIRKHYPKRMLMLCGAEDTYCPVDSINYYMKHIVDGELKKEEKFNPSREVLLKTPSAGGVHKTIIFERAGHGFDMELGFFRNFYYQIRNFISIKFKGKSFQFTIPGQNLGNFWGVYDVQKDTFQLRGMGKKYPMMQFLAVLKKTKTDKVSIFPNRPVANFCLGESYKFILESFNLPSQAKLTKLNK